MDEVFESVKKLNSHGVAPSMTQIYRYYAANTTQEKLVSMVGALVLQNKLTKIEEYYVTRGQEMLLQKIKKQKDDFSAKLNVINKLVMAVSAIPWVSMIAITGSAANQKTSSQDDIDFFVITRPQTLFVTRFLITILTYLHGLKRTRGVLQQANKACFNLWLDGANLAVPDSKQTYFAACETANMKIIINRGGVLQMFMQQNKWLYKCLPNLRRISDSARVDCCNSSGYLTKIVNFIFFIPQMILIKIHMKNEMVSYTQLWFHPLKRE